MNGARPNGTSSESCDGDRSMLADPTLDDLDATHRAWLAGYDLGLIHGQRMAAEHLAHGLLHRQAAEMAGAAVETARQRHGNEWARTIRKQAEAVD